MFRAGIYSVSIFFRKCPVCIEYQLIPIFIAFNDVVFKFINTVYIVFVIGVVMNILPCAYNLRGVNVVVLVIIGAGRERNSRKYNGGK